VKAADPASLELTDVAPPQGEVVIQVAAAGVNRADLMQRAGHYPPPPGASPILGLEVSGTVVSAPAGSGLQPGMPVCALLDGGGYAEQVACPAGVVLPIPEGIDLQTAAALPEVFATVWLNLVQLAGLKAGERLVVHAGASGIGTAAIQLAKQLGAHAFVTVGSEAKLALCRELGAEGAIRHGDWVSAAREWGGADVLLDPIGASYLRANQRVLNQDGRWVLIALLGGRTGEIDLGRLLIKRQRLMGSTLRSRSPDEKAGVMSGVLRDIWPALSAGSMRPVVDRVFPLEDADAAHAYVAANRNHGKVLLVV